MEVTYTMGGKATAGTDYTAPATPETLILAAGATTGTISFLTLDDGVLDPDETLTVTLSNPSTKAGSVSVNKMAAEATTTITDPGTGDGIGGGSRRERDRG